MSRYKIWNLSQWQKFQPPLYHNHNVFQIKWRSQRYFVWLMNEHQTHNIKGRVATALLMQFLSHLKQKAINIWNCVRQKSDVCDPGSTVTNTVDHFILTELNDICLTLSDLPARALTAHDFTRLWFHQSCVQLLVTCLLVPPSRAASGARQDPVSEST